MKDSVMLDGRGNDFVLSRSGPRQGKSLNGVIVSFRAAAREENLVGSGTDPFCHAIAALFKNTSCLPAKGVHRRSVSEAAPEDSNHRLNHLRIQRSCRAIIEIDAIHEWPWTNEGLENEQKGRS
jgi:hypothetical protein